MCPNCRETLLVLELEGIEIDYCESCGGIWLDSGELDLILQLEAPDEPSSESVSHKPSLADEIADTPKKNKTSKRCVRCNAKMDVVSVTEKSIVLDRCPLGDGIWFDRGELIHLIHLQYDNKTGIIAQFLQRFFSNELSESE